MLEIGLEPNPGLVKGPQNWKEAVIVHETGNFL